MTDEIEIKRLLGKRIKELRTNRGMTQERLAELIGVGQRNLSKIECGNNFITAETLSGLINALRVDAKDIFNFKHNDNKNFLKQDLLQAIMEEKIDIELLYRFYETIKL